jgi:hypothetical protein
MQPEIRRIIAVEAHRRRTGRCPTMIHSLGSGETFEIEPRTDGFIDLETGLRVRVDSDRIVLPAASIEIRMGEDVGFSAFVAGEILTGRSGGGSSVTVYHRDDYYQYAVVNEQGL